jgi:hypothetical protein
MKAEDGGLGLAALTEFNLRLWARETDAAGVTEWVLRMTIQLDALLPLKVSSVPPVDNHSGGGRPARILGLVEDDDLFFIWMRIGVFEVQLKSMQCKKVFETDVSATVLPYTGFYSTGADLLTSLCVAFTFFFGSILCFVFASSYELACDFVSYISGR